MRRRDVARRVRVTKWYAWEAGRALRHGSPRAVAVAQTVRGLADAGELPGPSDFESTIRQIGKAWVRRVPGRNLWVWYQVGDEEVVLVTVTSDPPVPFGA